MGPARSSCSSVLMIPKENARIEMRAFFVALFVPDQQVRDKQILPCVYIENGPGNFATTVLMVQYAKVARRS